MEVVNSKLLSFLSHHKMIRRCFILIFMAFLTLTLLFRFPFYPSSRCSNLSYTVSSEQILIREDKYLEVPQIVWGLNNQKIALARALLTAKMLNRTLLMPRLSASLFYKEMDLLQAIDFDKIFNFTTFNSLCYGFVRVGRFSDISNLTDLYEVEKGSGRKWTIDRDLNQLDKCRQEPIDRYETIRIIGKNPFLWHDHWPVKDYAKIFECLALIDEIASEVTKVVEKIKEVSKNRTLEKRTDLMNPSSQITTYMAVHMRIEKDWMIHCRKLEQRYNVSLICSSKEEIIKRVGQISGFSGQVVYIAVADSLLEGDSILSGWNAGLLPMEKKKLGVWDIFKKYPYLIQSAIDYEVCLRSDIFVGNSFSTFSSLIVLERTQRLRRMGVKSSCSGDVRWPSYAYNVLGENGGPHKWTTDMSDSNLRAVSYGSINISC